MVATISTITTDTLITFVKRTFGDESGVQITDDDIISWANSGVGSIASNLPINEAIASSTTVIGLDRYDLPPDLLAIKEVQVDTTMLTRVDFTEAKTTISSDSVGATSTPYWWYNFANSIFLYPLPSAILPLNIYYNSQPTQVTSATDLLGIPDRYFDLLCHYVMARAYELDENPSMMGAKLNQFEGELKKLSNVDELTRGSFPVVQEYQYGGNEAWDRYYAW